MRQSRVDWNDHIRQFIKIKLQKPEVLQELLKREQQFAERCETQQKIQSLRAKFEYLGKRFRTEQAEYQRNLQAKKKLQQEVTYLNGQIIRMEVEIDRLIHQQATTSLKQEKEERTRQSINSDTIPTKRYEELSVILAQHASTRDSITSELTSLIARKVELTQQFQKAAAILQQQINKKQVYEQMKLAQQSLKNLQNQLEKQQDRRYKLTNRAARAQKIAFQRRKSRDNYQLRAEQSSKRLQAFAKECKKLLMSEEDRNSKKYQQFINQYRVYTQQEQQQLKKQFNILSTKIQTGGLRYSLWPVTLQPETDNYEDLVVQIMKKFGKKSFSAKEYNQLENNVKQIGSYYAQLLQADCQLTPEIETLRQNLKRKVKQVQAVKTNPTFNRRSN